MPAIHGIHKRFLTDFIKYLPFHVISGMEIHVDNESMTIFLTDFATLIFFVQPDNVGCVGVCVEGPEGEVSLDLENADYSFLAARAAVLVADVHQMNEETAMELQ